MVAGATIIRFNHTATDDNPFRLTNNFMPFYDLNIHCYTHDAYYGDGIAQDAIIYADDIIFFRNGDLAEIFFKNQTPGSNCNIVAVATVPIKRVSRELGYKV